MGARLLVMVGIIGVWKVLLRVKMFMLVVSSIFVTMEFGIRLVSFMSDYDVV